MDQLSNFTANHWPALFPFLFLNPASKVTAHIVNVSKKGVALPLLPNDFR